MPQQPPGPDQVLAVNVARRWSEVEAGRSAEADVVLGEWSPWVGRSTTIRHFDPDHIAVVIACRRGETMAVYDVLPDADGHSWHWVGDGARQRIRFHGHPSSRYGAQLQAPAPTWKVGEGVPVKVLDLHSLVQDAATADRADVVPEHRHAVVGQAVIALADGGQLTVSVPPEYSVTVTTRTSHDRSL